MASAASIEVSSPEDPELDAGAPLRPPGAFPDLGPLRSVLKRFVRLDGRVDYAGLSVDGRMLELYLEDAADTDVEALSEPERIAFWVNTYNAFFLRAMVLWHPARSMRAIPAWDRRVILYIGQEELSLAALRERKLLATGDPRLLFVLRTGSASGPLVGREPLVPEDLDGQLDRAVREFLSDSTRNRFDSENRRAEISRLFDRYRDVFVGESGLDARSAVVEFLARSAPGLASWIREADVRVEFAPWSEELFSAR